MDDYGLRHLTEHLNLAKRYDQLHSLIETPEWYIVKSGFDPSQQMYAEDVSRSLATCTYQIESAIQSKDWSAAEGQLPILFAHSLLYTTIRSQASRIDPAILETLMKLGQSERAIRQVDLLLEPLEQAEACYQVAMALHHCNQITEARELMKRAASITTGLEIGIIDDLLPLQAKIAIALHGLGNDEDAQALFAQLCYNVGQLLQEGNESNTSLVSLVRALVHFGKTSDALALTRDQKDKEMQIQLLCVIISCLVELGDLQEARRYLTEAVTAIDDIKDLDVIENLASSLARLGEFDHARSLTDRLATRSRVNILAVMAQTAARWGDETRAILLFDECLNYIQHNNLIYQEPEICVQVARLLLQAGQKQKAQALLLLVYDAASENLSTWRISTLSKLASAFTDGGLLQQTDKLINIVLAQPEYLTDDWEQTHGLGTIADILVQVGYTQGLNDVLAYARRLSDHWQQARLLAALAKAWAQVGNRSAAQNAIDYALQAAENEQVLWRQALALVDVAEVLQNQFNIQQANLLLQQVETMTRQFDGEAWRAWVFAAVAQALAHRGELQQATEKFKAALDALMIEEDPNFQAAVITVISQMTISIKEPNLLNSLADIARKIDEEFLTAEGLFSVTYAMTEQDRLDEAWALFHEAVEVGHWRPVPINIKSQSIESSPSGVDRDWALNAIRSVGWPTARAAGSCALVSLFVKSNSLERFADLLDLVHDISRQHSQAKALALGAIARSIKTNTSLNQFDWLSYVVQMFQLAYQEDYSTTWGTINAILPQLAEYPTGASLVQSIWQRLVSVDRLLALDSVSTKAVE